jgi:nucleotide-binding universal stress UspA family protein
MIKTILVATDGSSHAVKATALAIDFARKFQARLVVLHSLLRDANSTRLRKLVKQRDLTKEQRRILNNYEVEYYTAMAGVDVGMTSAPAPIEILEPVGQQIVDRVVQAAKRAKVTRVSSVLSGGDPADSILNVAKKEKADLIVLGSRGFGDLRGLFLGSVSHKVAAHATCPVTTVK